MTLRCRRCFKNLPANQLRFATTAFSEHEYICIDRGACNKRLEEHAEDDPMRAAEIPIVTLPASATRVDIAAAEFRIAALQALAHFARRAYDHARDCAADFTRNFPPIAGAGRGYDLHAVAERRASACELREMRRRST